MDRAEKQALAWSIGILVLFMAAIVAAISGWGITVPDCITDVEPFEEGQLIQHDDLHYELQMVAHMWYFNPGQIELPVGATLDIYLTSADVVHGLHIDKTDINMMAIPGQISYLRVKFDEPGTYHFLCHEYCGIAHHTMAGSIVVKSPEEFQPEDMGAEEALNGAAGETEEEMGDEG